jgi:hypothetical protein
MANPLLAETGQSRGKASETILSGLSGERDQENKATRRELLERFCEGLAEVPTPEISDYHFEVDGAVFHESEQEAG